MYIGAILGGYFLTVTYHMICLIDGDHLHRNDGTHLEIDVDDEQYGSTAGGTK